MAESIEVIVDHPAPMLIRWGRGNGIGLFATRSSTPVSIRGVDPGDMAEPDAVPVGAPPNARIHGRRLWAPVQACGRGGWDRIDAPLAQALAHLTEPPRRARRNDEPGILGLSAAPLATPYGFALHHARAIQDAGEIPKSAREEVPAARAAASNALAGWVSSHLLHDGKHLYERLPLPMLNPGDPFRPSWKPSTDLHRPEFISTRVGHQGRIPYCNESIQALVTVAEDLRPLMGLVDADDEDIGRFLSTAPAALIPLLRAMRDPAADAAMDRLWPLLVSGARAEEPCCGREAAAGAIRAAAGVILDKGRRVLGAGNMAIPMMRAEALESCIGFVNHVVMPSLSGPAPEEDEQALVLLGP